MSEYSLISTAGLTKPATLLIEKVSNAFGRHFDRRQTIRMAEAETEADRIVRVGATKTDIEVAELRQRAADRFINEEMTKQVNIESITQLATQALAEDADPEKIEDDWITNFFDKSRIVSDFDMQLIWGKILAGEANNSGSFSRKTVNLVADIDKHDALLFTNLCNFTWTIGGFEYPLVYDTQSAIYQSQNIYLETLIHLQTLGLVEDGGSLGFRRVNLPQTVDTTYFGRPLALNMPKVGGNQLATGQAMFTRPGRELKGVCSMAPVPGFFEYVHDRWADEKLAAPRVG